jgi:hypothetical protein
MGAFLVVIPVGLLALILFFVASSNAAGWATLICLAVWNVFVFFKSVAIYNYRRRSDLGTTGAQVLMAASQPFVAVITLFAIVLLLFIDVSKIHLLWFYLLISIMFEYTVGLGAVKKFEASQRAVEKVLASQDGGYPTEVGGTQGIRCPKCGAETTIRTGKQSGRKFHFCVNYPRCKGSIACNEDGDDDWDE